MDTNTNNTLKTTLHIPINNLKNYIGEIDDYEIVQDTIKNIKNSMIKTLEEETNHKFTPNEIEVLLSCFNFKQTIDYDIKRLEYVLTITPEWNGNILPYTRMIP